MNPQSEWSEGNLLVWAEGERWLPLLAVETVDTTGAGDAFAGALASALASGRALEEAASFANAAAALPPQNLARNHHCPGGIR